MASTTAAFELLGRLSPRREASASTGCITLDLSTDDLASQGYVTDGNEPFSVDTFLQRIVITDASTVDRRSFTRTCPDIPISAIEVDVIISVSPNGITPSGEDIGVHAVLIEGTGLTGITGNEVRAACILRGAERRLAIQLSTGLYVHGHPFRLGW